MGTRTRTEHWQRGQAGAGALGRGGLPAPALRPQGEQRQPRDCKHLPGRVPPVLSCPSSRMVSPCHQTADSPLLERPPPSVMLPFPGVPPCSLPALCLSILLASRLATCPLQSPRHQFHIPTHSSVCARAYPISDPSLPLGPPLTTALHP